MTALYWILLLVACQRVGEALYARHNARRLLAAGGYEAGAGHYPLIVALHAAWLASLALLVDPEAALNLPLLALFVALQGLRLWIIVSLGRYWTTRIVTVPEAPLVRRGPYRYFRHPNYAVVAAEIALLPLVFGAWKIAALFSVLNAVVLWHRIRVEARALAPRRARG